MARPSGPKTRCSGQWTEARYNSFIQSMLRAGTRRWAPKSEVMRRARVERGWYICEGCGAKGPTTIKDKGKKVKNAIVDHIKPIVDPEVGFTTWDEYIEGMFCESSNLQLLCHDCHTSKSKEEREVATERRRRERDDS